ncbi:MAG: hypothetical protein AAF664_19710, partial [Planctomycetota bacterium]
MLSCFMVASAAAETSKLDSAKFRFGDDLEWADPGFDDSNWEVVQVPQSWAKELDPFGMQICGWYRFSFEFPTQGNRRIASEVIDSRAPINFDVETDSNLALSIGVVSDACEVYLDGSLIGRAGRMPPRFDGLPLDCLVIPGPSLLACGPKPTRGSRSCFSLHLWRRHFGWSDCRRSRRFDSRTGLSSESLAVVR